MLNPIFSKKVQGQKHPGRWGIVEHQIPSIKMLHRLDRLSSLRWVNVINLSYHGVRAMHTWSQELHIYRFVVFCCDLVQMSFPPLDALRIHGSCIFMPLELYTLFTICYALWWLNTSNMPRATSVEMGKYIIPDDKAWNITLRPEKPLPFGEDSFKKLFLLR